MVRSRGQPESRDRGGEGRAPRQVEEDEEQDEQG